jgi:signal transduction histidine kinase
MRSATASRFGAIRPVTALCFGTMLLISTILGTNLLVLGNMREASLKEAQSSLAKYSTTLAEHADRSFKSLELVLAGIEEHVIRQGVHDSASYELLMAGFDTHQFLKERFSGLPQVDAITLIRADGKLVNFSRYWPIPDVNIADRDYYKALKEDTTLKSFISQPVPNRGTGTSTIYMARRLSAPNGDFIGLVLGAMALTSFEEFFERTSPGDGSSVSMIREDGMLLVRYPPTDQIGKVFPRVLRTTADSKSAISRGASPIDQHVRIKSTNYLSNYPLLILATQTEASALREWHQMFSLFAVVSAVATGIVILCAFVIARWWLQQANLARVRNEKAQAERSKAIAEANLLRARESAAEAASRAKSSFLAVMSHEIRTPMNAVLGYASSLLDGSLQPDQRKAIAAIHEAGDNLLEILNDILDYSKLEAGQLTLENVAFSPQAVIDSALSIMAPRAKAKGLILRSERDAAIPKALSGDVGRLRQVLLNLVANAVKFTETGGVSISARCLCRATNAATVEWSVSDSGIGIDPDRIGALFKEFMQADCTINRRFGGSGLGLSICKRIIDQMDGQISAASTIGQGTTVRLPKSVRTGTTLEKTRRQIFAGSWQI